MQFPASNFHPNRFHRLVRNCRTEIDEELPVPILRSPWPKRVAQKIELLVRIGPSPVIILAIDHFRLLRMKLQPTLLQTRGCGCPNLLGFHSRSTMYDGNHRRNAQTVTADTASPSIDQKHSAETDWLTEG